MSRFLVVALRMVLILLAVVSLVFQIVLPLVAVELGRQFPELDHLVLPYSIAAVVAVLFFEVALVAVWRLLSMAAGGGVFTEPALRWVDVVIACAAAVTVLSCAVFVHLVFIENNGGPGALGGLVLSTVVGAAAVLLMVVLRRLLQAATADRRELAEVI